jgi:hypothetical protein
MRFSGGCGFGRFVYGLVRCFMNEDYTLIEWNHRWAKGIGLWPTEGMNSPAERVNIASGDEFIAAPAHAEGAEKALNAQSHPRCSVGVWRSILPPPIVE